MICRDAADEKQQPAVAEEEKEDTVTIIDEAPNAIAFFCKLLTSVRDAVLNADSEQTQTRHQTPNSTGWQFNWLKKKLGGLLGAYLGAYLGAFPV